MPETTENDKDTEATQDTEAAKTKVPPIYIHNASNYQTVADDIKNTIDSENFSIQCKSNSMKIVLTDSDHFRKLTAFYDEQDIQYHTFQNPDNALLSVVVRNIPISVTDEDIKTELSKKFTVKRVTRLLNKDKYPMPLCAVDIERDDNSSEIFNVTRYEHSIISVEPRRKSKDIPQCTRCQRYGHTKNYCKLEPRCVKCTQNHHYSQCPKRAGEKPSCINCEGDHTANYRGCPYYTNIKTKISSQQHQNRTQINSTDSELRNDQPKERRSTLPPRNFSNTRSYANGVRNDENSISSVFKTLLDFITPYLDQIKQFICSLFTSMFSSTVQH